jgi:hypothetical protein
MKDWIAGVLINPVIPESVNSCNIGNSIRY